MIGDVCYFTKAKKGLYLKGFYLFLLFAFLVPINAKANFDLNANCLKAYNNILELRLNSAKQIIAVERKNNPTNGFLPFLDNYVDYFTLLTSESKSDFDRLKNNKSKRLSSIEDQDRNSPYYLYTQAEINLQWALIRGRFGEYFGAAMEIKKAYNLLQENTKKYPSFPLNNKGLGLINAVLGSLPDGVLKGTLSTFGIKGNKQQGIKMLEGLADSLPQTSYEPFYEETVFYLSYVLADVLNDPSAYTRTMHYTNRISDSSLLKTYLRAYVCMKTSHNDEAIAALASKPTSADLQPYPYLDYLMGVAKLNKLDLGAESSFNKYLTSYKGINYVKDTYLRLSWISVLRSDTKRYSDLVSKLRSSGSTYHEKDKQAIKEANDPVPDLELLQGRLLFDGGYYQRALAVIKDKSVESCHNIRDKTELNYRLGRIYDVSGKDDQALKYYQNAVNYGKNERYFFASNAALMMGHVYEAKRNKAQAKASYTLALSMKDHDYENSISAKAKEGLKRINN